MKLKKKKQEKSLTLVLLMVCQFTAFYKKKKSPLLMDPRLTYLENVRRDCNGYYFAGLII